MRNASPAELAAKWAQRTQNAVSDFEKGVMAVDVAPGQLAAAQKEKYVRRVQERADKWADRVAQVSLANWKAITAKKGRERIGSGVQAAVPKFQAFINDFMNFQRSTVMPALSSMPKNTLEDGIARATYVIRANAEFGRGRRGVAAGGFGFPVPAFQ